MKYAVFSNMQDGFYPMQNDFAGQENMQKNDFDANYEICSKNGY